MKLYLVDMLEAVDAVSRFLAGLDRQAFGDSELVQSAVLQKLMVIGEAAGRVSNDVRERCPSIQWKEIIGFRNIAIHAYFEIEWSIVWTIASSSLPLLRRELRTLLVT